MAIGNALTRLHADDQQRIISIATAQVQAERAQALARGRTPTLVRPDSLIGFTRQYMPRYQAGAVHHYVAAQIEQALRTRQWTMLFMPPQHGKSELASVNAPPYYLGAHPSDYWVAVSYGIDLARRNSRNARTIVRTAQYAETYGLSLDRSVGSLTEWEFAGGRMGGFYATGIRGGLTGRPAHVMVIDDPVKDRKEADSPVMRQSNMDWWTGTGRARLQPDSVVFLIMTRWHHDDLAGRLLRDDDERNRWNVIRLPARAEDNDPLGRKVGEVLWPERFDTPDEAEQFYTDMQRDQGPRDWAALGQQTPTLDTDAMFQPQWWAWYDADELPPATMPNRGWLAIIQYWDTAFKEKTTSDFNACVTFGLTGDSVWLLDVYNERHEMPDLLDMAAAKAAQFLPTHLEVEDKASGPSLAQLLRRRTGRPVHLWEPPGDIAKDKIGRAYAVQPIAAAGQIRLPRTGAPWLGKLLEQLYQFPASEHDDMVDAFVGALHVAKEIWDGIRTVAAHSTYSGGGRGGYVDGRYVDSDTGAAPSPELVRRRY